MHIIQVTPSFPPYGGGIGSYVDYLSRELAARGHRVEVLFRGQQDRHYRWEGIRVTEIRVPGLIPFNNPLFRRRLQKYIQRSGADIVHVHSSAMPSLTLAIPVVVTAHWCNSVGIPVFHRPIREWDALYRNIMLPLYRIIERRLVTTCDRFTVVSQSLQSEFQIRYGVRADVILNGVDTGFFKPAGDAAASSNILFTGCLAVGKGALDILQIAEKARTRIPGVRFTLIGQGPLSAFLEKRIKTGRLDHIELVGHVTHDRIRSYYHSAEVFLFPSHYEGLPTVALEAMACGLPVIASAVSGIPEQVEHGVTGLLCPPGDVDRFVEAVADLLGNDAKCKRFGKAGRKRVEADFTWPRIADRVVANYHNLLTAN
jgi:glycosyltransferase involved in cell wall biosynthesis